MTGRLKPMEDEAAERMQADEAPMQALLAKLRFMAHKLGLTMLQQPAIYEEAQGEGGDRGEGDGKGEEEKDKFGANGLPR